jgi:hypothetical protein
VTVPPVARGAFVVLTPDTEAEIMHLVRLY